MKPTFHSRVVIIFSPCPSNEISLSFHSENGTDTPSAFSRKTRLKPQTRTGSVGWNRLTQQSISLIKAIDL